jgi:predicted alpha/beta superfamily hydrolase
MKTPAASYHAPEITTHLISSSVVAQSFRIKVLQPVCKADGSERFPVVYATDGDDLFEALGALSKNLQAHGEVPRFILVGVGYQDPRAASMLRMRDYYPHAIRSLYATETEQLARSEIFGGVDIETITQTTDAGEFLKFIRAELMPLIESSYPTVPDDSTYFGYSAGGLFGLYTLSTQPETFSRYILGSLPTTYRGKHFGIELIDALALSGRAIPAKVALTVGELEELVGPLAPFDLVTGYCQLTKRLRAGAIPGLELFARILPGETHATAWAGAFGHGLRSLFRPAREVPFLPDFLR